MEETEATNASSTISGKEKKYEQSKVTSASYPLSKPLAEILQRAIVAKGQDQSNASQCIYVVKERAENALQELIRNCFVAIDDVFFSTSPSQRNHPAFQHRLCIRISTCQTTKTLSITDNGSGMTRSDLINSLGIGSRISSKTARVIRALSSNQKQPKTKNGNVFDSELDEDTDVDDITSTSSSDTDDDDDYDTKNVVMKDEESTLEDMVYGDENNKQDGSDIASINLPCRAQDIGGFYAALCALGTEVEIGTKSKFDDYYVFKLGKDEQNNFSQFMISRPMQEGTKPSISNGFDKFSDVRGESGTRVTISLNEDAINAGLCKEEVLKPILEKALESSSYSVLLQSLCTEVERRGIIWANQKEEEEFKLIDNSDETQWADEMDTEYVNRNQEVEPYQTVKERSKFIPLRLSLKERKLLRLVEAAMLCSDYTADVDKQFKSASRRTHAQLKGIVSILRGTATAVQYDVGQKLLEEENYNEYEHFFESIFEIARRHKIMNPEKMRTEYGKLVYLLQDIVSPSIQPHLSFSCKGCIETVYKFLEERNGLALLDDDLIDIATREVLAEKKTRNQIGLEIKRKEKAVAILKQNHRSTSLSSEDIHLCLYSICDNDSFLNSNRVPIDKIIGYLKHYFSPTKIEDGYSLSIVSGQDGARLSHSHERQFYFALQSLTLWRDIIDDMFRLWAMAEDDLLSESISYTLQDTGQGTQRVQQSPLTYKCMQTILSRVQGKVKQWIGSKVIHLGDHNVPNALTFIDKYTQVPRILGPIVSCLENVERICEDDEGINTFIESGFGGVEQLKKDILYDFFKSAFDGSGADNFYDAGSCIDGRLTSAWNWCSQLPSKPFYCIFKLTGFTGFDGEFK